MNTTRRFGLAILSIIGLTLFTTQAAHAQAEYWGTAPLTNTRIEPNASGEMSVWGERLYTFYEYDGWGGWYEVTVYAGRLSVSCQGLTPGRSYRVSGLGNFKASASGKLAADGSVTWEAVTGWHNDESREVSGGGFGVDVSFKSRGRWVAVLTGGVYEP